MVPIGESIGAVATAVATALAYWVEAGLSLPAWAPYLVMVCGLIGTTFGVSKTRNGMTDSVADVLRTALVDRIDSHHDQDGPTAQAAVAAAAVQSAAQAALDVSSRALDTQELRAAAERIAGTGSLSTGSLG